MKHFFLLAFIVASFLSHSQTWMFDSLVNPHTGNFTFCKDPWNNIYCYDREAYSNPYAVSEIKKLRPNGTLLWKKTFHSNMQVRSIAAANDSSIYIGGVFGGTINIAGYSYTCQGGWDVWIAKYTGGGVPLWCKTISSRLSDELGEICMNGTGLVVTGTTGDTVNFMGSPVTKPMSKTQNASYQWQTDLFVAKTDGNGSFQSVKFAIPIIKDSVRPNSYGNECAVDPYGNIFVMGAFIGASMLDTFHLGVWQDEMMSYQQAVVKFNSQLQVQYAYRVEACYSICTDKIQDLITNGNGDAYFVRSYSYGQSGNDDQYSWICRLDHSGSCTNTFQPRPDKKTYLWDIDLDKCGNIYYTGFARDYANAQINYFCLLNGQTDPYCAPQWMHIDSSATNFMHCSAVAVLGNNDLFIGGFFSDTLQLAQQLVDTNSYYGYSGFFGRLTRSAVSPCLVPDVTSIKNVSPRDVLTLYPNPCTNHFNVELDESCEVNIYAVNGQIVQKQFCSSGQKLIDTSILPCGIYLIRIKSATAVRSTRLLVQRE